MTATSVVEQNGAATGELLLEVKNLQTHFPLDEGTVRAVDGVSYNLYRGRTLGIVGESGCGKSVTAQSILRIVPSPGQIVDGEIIYHRRKRDSAEQLAPASAYGSGLRGRFGGRGPSRVG